MNIDISCSGVQEGKLEHRCGEIFMSSKRNLIFHCCLCDTKYNGFGEYATHLHDHYPSSDAVLIEEVEIKNETPYNAELYIGDRLLEETDVPFFDTKPTSLSKSTKIDSPEKENNVKAKHTGDIKPIINATEGVQNETLITECRPVRKKSNYFQTPDEIRKFKCTICPATFKDSSSLKKHVARHTTQKSHQCPQCPKMFYTPIDVKKHLTVHKGERPFLCTICGKTCLSSFKLKDHMRRHTNQRDYKCSYCEKGFYNAGLLSEHMQVHSNERRHKCSICEASFTYRKGLRNHLKLHENKREFKCELCSASFNQQAGLFSHMKNKHKTV